MGVLGALGVWGLGTSGLGHSGVYDCRGLEREALSPNIGAL